MLRETHRELFHPIHARALAARSRIFARLGVAKRGFLAALRLKHLSLLLALGFQNGGLPLAFGFKNERTDKLIEEARLTLDKNRRKELYTEVDNIVNEEAALIYAHAVPLTSAGVKSLKGYAPTIAGPHSWSGGGIRTAYFDK